jgi:hypothetical protein
MLELGPTDEPSEAQLALVDHAAALTIDPDRNFDEIRSLYSRESALTVGEKVKNWQTRTDEAVPTA